jgi:hypothetical protein
MSTPETNVVDQREFWEARVNSYIQRFEYGADGRDMFVDNMMRMGYERDDVEDILDDEEEI